MRGSTVGILHVASGELTFSIMAGWKFFSCLGILFCFIHNPTQITCLFFIEVFGCFCPGIESCKSQYMLGIHIPTSGYRNNLDDVTRCVEAPWAYFMLLQVN